MVAGGRKKSHPKIVKKKVAMGCCQEGITKDTVAGKPATAHI
jgi:chitin synthase